MALKATIYKADLQIADMDRHYYQDHSLTIALHPSETEERMMARLLAFVLHASENLAFTKGISTDDEPDIWNKDLVGDIELWIDVGLPDEKRIRKACNRSREVAIYAYGARSAAIWWEQTETKVNRFENLRVSLIEAESLERLAALAERTMRLQCTIQDGVVWIANQEDSVQVELRHLKEIR